MSFLRKINQMSFKAVGGISIFMAVLVSVPVGVYLTQQETQIDSQAAYEKPTEATEPKATPGPIPVEAPVIGRVFPWVGKIGDVVWVQGENFGSNPEVKELKIGGVVVSDDDIEAWDDDLIQAIIPEGAKQGGIVELTVGSHPKSRSLPYVLYEQSTEVKLGKREGKIIIDNGSSQASKAIVWTGDDEVEQVKHDMDINFAGDSKTIVFDTQGLPLKSVLLFDNEGKLLPYYVSVIEFDF